MKKKIESRQTHTCLRLTARYLTQPKFSSALMQGMKEVRLWSACSHFGLRCLAQDVILDSTVAVTQGVWLATTASSTVLANGTNITSPLGGYQYVPVAGINLDEDYSLEGWTDCPSYANSNAAWYNSSIFTAKAKEAAPFLASLAPIIGNRPAVLTNMWNIYESVLSWQAYCTLCKLT